MFAVLNINNIILNAGHELALSMQAFFMSANIVSIFLKGYRHLDTPVWSVNAPTAFRIECVKRRGRSGCFFYLTSWYKINPISKVQRLAPTRRSLTKRASATANFIPTASVFTMRQASAAVVRRTVFPCAKNSSHSFNCSTQPSVSSRLKTAVRCLWHASRLVAVALFITQPIHCLTWQHSSAKACHLCPHSLALPGIYINVAHLVFKVSKLVAPLKLNLLCIL